MRWQVVPLKTISELGPQYGANLRAIPPSGKGIRYVRITDIDDFGELRPDSFVEPDGNDLENYLLSEGDLLLARSGATVGKSYRHIPENGQCAFAGYLIRFRPNARIVNSCYLNYFLQSSTYWIWVNSKKRVAAQPNISGAEYATISVPLPPPSEQARIVEILDEADRLRRLRREADAKAACILPALFLKMFGDPATNPKGWDLTTIGNLTSAIDYGTSTKSSDDGSGIPLIRMGNVDYNGHLDLRDLKHIQLSESEVARFRLEDGDILFNRTNSKELVGKTGLWDVDIEALAASYFIRIRVDCEQVTPTFFWAFMNCSYMKKVLRLTARGAIGQANINSSELRAFAIYRPPLDRQHLFANRWKQIRATIPQRIGDQTDLDSLFATLLQRAFSGQLTAKWRDAHSKELLAEMEQQARLLNLPLPKELETMP